MPIDSDEILPPTILSTTEIRLKDIVMILNWSKIFHKLIQKTQKTKFKWLIFGKNIIVIFWDCFV